jgi:hypothetical protein
MAVSDKPWSSFSEADYTPEQFCRAALIDMNPPGKDKAKGQCKLPVLEPNGDVNRNGVHAAAAVLAGGRGGVQAPPDMKRSAAKRLIGWYRVLKEDPPENLVGLAG